MKQFSTILSFEFRQYLKNKIFVGITLFLAVVIAALMFLPPILDREEVLPDTPDTEVTPDVEEIPDVDKPVMLLRSEVEGLSTALLPLFSATFSEYEVKAEDMTLDKVKEGISDGSISCAFDFKAMTSYVYYVNNLSMYDSNTIVVDDLLRSFYQTQVMISAGLSPEEAAEVMNVIILSEVQSLGKDQMQNFFYTYIMIFALYMVILLYGQMVATNVASEKSSRAMELLVTSATPTNMMFGKVIASCLAGLCQLIAVFGTAFVGFNCNRSYWDCNMIVSSIFDIPLDLLLYMLVFFVLGFFVYAFLYGAIGSMASKVEDINTTSLPLTFAFIAAFMVVVFSMSSGTVDNTAMVVCSYIPFTSPMAMFTRIAMSTVPLYEILLSIGILLGSVIGIGILSAKIYRVGVLLYGTPPKLGAILKAIRKA